MEYLEVIEKLSQSKSLHEGDIYNFSKEVLKTAAKSLGCRRTNAWVFNRDRTVMNSIQSYNAQTDQFKREPPLKRKQLPNYFNYLTQNKIIVSDDALNETMNKELVDSYLMPNHIKSMIDVPLRSEGAMVGVICFEAVGEAHRWTPSDIKFVQSLAQLLSIAIETNQKNLYRRELEKTIRQKEVLLSEINHRVKNNMSVIIGLINLQKHKSKDAYHEGVLEELQEKIYSMALVQNHLHNNRSLVKVELGKYLEDLIQNIHETYGLGKNIQLDLNMEKAVIDISKGIPLGLIANEILTNAFKYAFADDSKDHKLIVRLLRGSNEIHLHIKDNGPGYDQENFEAGMGLELISDLTEQISGSLLVNPSNGVEVQVKFPIEE